MLNLFEINEGKIVKKSINNGIALSIVLEFNFLDLVKSLLSYLYVPGVVRVEKILYNLSTILENFATEVYAYTKTNVKYSFGSRDIGFACSL
jgi:hypothetical protein